MDLKGIWLVLLRCWFLVLALHYFGDRFGVSYIHVELMIRRKLCLSIASFIIFFSHIVEPVILNRIVSTATLEHSVSKITLEHIIAIGLDTIIVLDTIVAFIIPFIALLTSSPVVWREELL